MEQSQADIKLGRFLSLVLRHEPQAAGITLDQHGWADVEALIAMLSTTATPKSGPAKATPSLWMWSSGRPGRRRFSTTAPRGVFSPPSAEKG